MSLDNPGAREFSVAAAFVIAILLLAMIAPTDQYTPVAPSAITPPDPCDRDGGVASAYLETTAGQFNTYEVTCTNGVGPFRVAR